MNPGCASAPKPPTSMHATTIHAYKHSGKFSFAGPVAAIAIALIAALPLGMVYAYAVKWIPIVYLNVLMTAGYGLAFGAMTMWVLKRTKVRNTAVAALVALIVGLIALYGAWNGHFHALWEDPPLVAPPLAIWVLMQVLYEAGSWSLRGSDNVSGIPLAIVWIIEGGVILVLTVVTAAEKIRSTPFCEATQRWLDRERKLDTLAPFSDPAQLAALKSGDVAPLLDAKPRESNSPAFARVTLRDAEGCDTFCTMELENVTVTRDSEGKQKEKTDSITGQLVLPHAMRDLVEKFASFDAAPAATTPDSARAVTSATQG
jgi:hypothetical protein